MRLYWTPERAQVILSELTPYPAPADADDPDSLIESLGGPGNALALLFDCLPHLDSFDRHILQSFLEGNDQEATCSRLHFVQPQSVCWHITRLPRRISLYLEIATARLGLPAPHKSEADEIADALAILSLCHTQLGHVERLVRRLHAHA